MFELMILHLVNGFVCFCDRLADLANFHLQMTKAYNLTEENKWISFGGSYPGSLSAWFRIKVLIIKVKFLMNYCVASVLIVSVNDFFGHKFEYKYVIYLY